MFFAPPQITHLPFWGGGGSGSSHKKQAKQRTLLRSDTKNTGTGTKSRLFGGGFYSTLVSIARAPTQVLVKCLRVIIFYIFICICNHSNH